MAVHHERAFGDAIVAALVASGWERGDTADYRADLGLDAHQLLTFIGATQAAEWEELVTFYGGDPNAAQRGFYRRLDQAISTDGLLDVLRKGVKDQGVRIRVAYFKPSFVESEEVLADYRRNRLTVVRELPYATKQADRGNRLDLTLFLNGIPVATAELKNPLTGSGVEHAKEQYRTERDATEPIFSRRVIANFAVDPDRVFVTTQLRGKPTRFLPFNTGSAGPGRPGGKGNPPPTEYGKYATSYLWEEIWQRDIWLDLLERTHNSAAGRRTPRRVPDPLRQSAQLKHIRSGRPSTTWSPGLRKRHWARPLVPTNLDDSRLTLAPSARQS